MHHVLLIIVLGYCAAAAYVDVRTGKIPNLLHAAALLAVCVAGVVGAQSGLVTENHWVYWVKQSLTGCIACAIPAVLLYASKTIGAGDAKALCCVGFITGADVGLQITVASLVVAALYGLSVVALRGSLQQALVGSGILVRQMLRSTPRKDPVARTLLRFGPPLFVAALAVGVTQW